MRRRDPFAALVMLALVLPACRHPSAPVPLRRVILISIDTLRSDHLGAYGYARPTSPRIDELAKNGVLFERATSPAPWTLPAHASLLTGLYPSHHGLRGSEVALPASIATIGTILTNQGFATAAVVNSNYLSPVFGLDRGFQRFEYVKEGAAEREPSRAITDRAIEWLQAAGDRRVFLFVHYYDVHSDYASLPEYERRFVRPYAGNADGTTAQMMAVRAGRIVFDEADIQHVVDLYDAGIRQMDDELGRLLDAIGSRDDTLLVLVSDHGEEFFDHGGVLHGRTQFDELVRVPLILQGDGVPVGVRVTTTVSLIDVMPTILAAAGVTAPPGLDGLDLAPTWRGGVGLAERYLFHEADHNNAEPEMHRAVRHGNDKLHLYRLTGQVTLFDLGTDPGERTDVAARRPEIAADLRAHLEGLTPTQPQAARSVTLPPEQIEKLKALGYAH